MASGAAIAGARRKEGTGNEERDTGREGGHGSGKVESWREQRTATSLPLVKKEPTPCVISRRYLVPRKVVIKSLELLDSEDSHDRPGMLYEKTLRDMVERFDTVFGKAHSSKNNVDGVIEHLKKHTKRRRGPDVLDPDPGKCYLEWEQTARIYDLFSTDLNVFERIFFTVDVGESSAYLSKVCSCFLILMIVISIVTWMVSTMPAVQHIEAGCTSIEKGKCVPKPHKIFDIIESVCVITFTIEYLIRLMTVHSVRFALLDEHFMVAVLSARDLKEIKGQRSDRENTGDAENAGDSTQPEKVHQGKPPHPEKLEGKLRTLLRWLSAGPNVIDLLAIIPFWLETFNLQAGGGFLVVLRILRLTRIFRVFKVGKYNDVFTLFSRVVEQSLPALLLMIFFIVLGCCLFGTLMWFAEQGTWYPENNPRLSALSTPISGRGAWLRHTGSKDEYDLEESPFQSIVHSFWYVIVTITTVGYGDISPTTPVGKLIASVAILKGIIVLAMPIGVVGANFGTEYTNVQAEKKKRKKEREKSDDRQRNEQREDEALNEHLEDAVEQHGSADGKKATELKLLDEQREKIIHGAQKLEEKWASLVPVLPKVMNAKLAESLRFFVFGLIHTRDAAQPELTAVCAKPKIQTARLVELDALTAQVIKAISTVTAEDEMPLKEFDPPAISLKDSLSCRKQWFDFTDSCWEYAVTMCIIEKRQDPPEYFQMKARLAAKVGVNNGSANRNSRP